MKNQPRSSLKVPLFNRTGKTPWPLSRLMWLLLATLLATPSMTRAQTITWGGGTETADTDVVTNGTSVMAYSFSGQSPTVNGVAFTGTLTTSGVAPNFSLSGTTNGVASPVQNSQNYIVGANGAPYTTLSPIYQQTIQGAAYGANSSILNLSVSNLTVGHAYALQLWILETRAAYKTRTVIIAGANTNAASTVTIAYNLIQAANGVGQYAIGVFTATNATQKFSLTGAAPQINAFQIRDVTGAGYTPPPVPRALTVTWNGGSAADSNWSDSTNWNGSNVVNNAVLLSATFSGVVRQSNTNDLSGVNLSAVSITSSNWNFTGNPVTLNGTFAANVGGTNVWGLDSTLNATPVVTLTVPSTYLNFSGLLSGGGAIALNNSTTSSGTMALSNPNNNFTGVFINYGGNLVYNVLAPSGQPSSLGAGTTPLYVGSGGSPAAMTFVGTSSVNTDRGLVVANNSAGGRITFNNNSPNNSSQTFNARTYSDSDGSRITAVSLNLSGATSTNDTYTVYLGGTSSGTNSVNGGVFQVVSNYVNASQTYNYSYYSFLGNLDISGPGTWLFNDIVKVTGTATVEPGAHLALGYSSKYGNSNIGLGALVVKPGGILDVSSYDQNGATFAVGGHYPGSLTAGRTDGTSATDINGSLSLGASANSILSIAGNGVPGTLTINGNFTPAIANSGVDLINFDFGSTTNAGAAVNDLIQVNGNLDLSQGVATILVYALQGTVQTGTPYTLINYTGSLTGNASGLTAPVFDRAHTGVISTATPNVVTVTFNASGNPPASHLVWTGASSANWDVAATTNWSNGGNSDYFYPFDNPFFDDTASQFNVSLVGNVQAGVVTVTNNNNPYSFGGGQLVGAASLVKQGTSTLTLNAANSYSGGTVINDGTVAVASGAALGSGPVTNNSTLSIINPNNLLLLAFSNTITGVGSLSLPSAEVVNFIGANSLAGFTGGVSVPSGGAFWASGVQTPATINISGTGVGTTAALQVDSSSSLTGPVNLQGNITFGVASGTSTISGNISDGGNGYGLTKVGGAGNLTLTGTNTYTGTTLVTNGTVNVTGIQNGGGWNMPLNSVAGTVNFQPGSRVTVNNTNVVQLGSWPAVGSANETLNSYGFVTNNGTLFVARAGNLIVSSNVWVQNGNLTNNPPNVSGYSSFMQVNPAGTFIYNGTSSITMGSSVGNSGNGNLTINGGVFKTGQGFVNASATSLATAATTGYGNLVITNNGTLAFSANLSGLMTSTYGATNYFRIGAANIDNGGYNIVLPDNIINVAGQIGSLTLTNTGTVTLAGTNTYTGVTTISGGRLIVNGTLASSNINVNAGTILGGTGVISGSVAITGTVSPGGSANVATLKTGAETWNSGGAYEFSVSNTVSGAGQDLLNLTGGLTLPTNTATFTVKLVSLAGNAPGALADFDANGSYAWTLATASGGITNFVPGAIIVDTTGFANAFTQSFGVTTNGNSLVLVYPYTAPIIPPTLIKTSTSFSGGGFNFSFSGPSGQTYKVLTSTNLTWPLASWTVLTSGTFGFTPVMYQDTGATNEQQFYRVTSP